MQTLAVYVQMQMHKINPGFYSATVLSVLTNRL